MKVIIIAIGCLAALLWIAALPRQGVHVDCTIAEFHPDLVKYRDQCRRARRGEQ